MANVFSKAVNFLEAVLDSRIDELKKSQETQTENDLLKAERSDGTIGRKGLIMDPFTQDFQSAGLFKQRVSYLSPAILKQVSRRDPIVAAVIDTRASQVASACKKQANRFDLGFKFQPKNKEIEADADEISKAEEFILNCGYKDDRPEEDKLTFDQFGYMFTRDIMVYGHAAVEKILRRDGQLHSFLPLPAETIYYANKKVDSKTIEGLKNSWEKVIDSNNVSVDRAARGEYEFVQVLGSGKIAEGFCHDELIFVKFPIESDLDLNGYAYGCLERALSSVISHMQIENHQRQFFVHGIASKGLLVLQGDVTPNTLSTLQRQWNNQITGPMNAWRTPILAGIQGVQWVPLTSSNRDMEYAAWQDYILRVLCTAMAISPEEIGFDYLSRGTEQRTLSESNNEWKITASRDRGLRPILGRIESMINEQILPAYSKNFAAKYHFSFVGLDAETEMEEIQRLQAETQLHTTLDEARKQAERDPLPYGGNIVLNPSFLQIAQSNMPKGLFMEVFMGIQGASERPDLQYIPDPLWFQWQQMQQQMMMSSQQPGPAGGGDPGATDGGDPNAPDSGQPQAQGGPDEQQAQMEAEEQERQAQQQAIDAYMAANPELFKALTRNLEKAGDLQKAERAFKAVNVRKIEQTRDQLVKDFRKVSESMMREIMEVVSDDLKQKTGKDSSSS